MTKALTVTTHRPQFTPQPLPAMTSGITPLWSSTFTRRIRGMGSLVPLVREFIVTDSSFPVFIAGDVFRAPQKAKEWKCSWCLTAVAPGGRFCAVGSACMTSAEGLIRPFQPVHARKPQPLLPAVLARVPTVSETALDSILHFSLTFPTVDLELRVSFARSGAMGYTGGVAVAPVGEQTKSVSFSSLPSLWEYDRLALISEWLTHHDPLAAVLIAQEVEQSCEELVKPLAKRVELAQWNHRLMELVETAVEAYVPSTPSAKWLALFPKVSASERFGLRSRPNGYRVNSYPTQEESHGHRRSHRSPRSR